MSKHVGSVEPCGRDEERAEGVGAISISHKHRIPLHSRLIPVGGPLTGASKNVRYGNRTYVNGSDFFSWRISMLGASSLADRESDHGHLVRQLRIPLDSHLPPDGPLTGASENMRYGNRIYVDGSGFFGSNVRSNAIYNKYASNGVGVSTLPGRQVHLFAMAIERPAFLEESDRPLGCDGNLSVSESGGRGRLGTQVFATFALLFLLLFNFLLIPQPLSAVGFTQSDFTCDSVEQISAAECAILVELYVSTDGDNWLNNGGWLQTNNPCEWYGLQCDQGEHITRIFLGGNKLAGPIPPEIGDLPELTWLQLNDNQLTGLIPPSLGQLTKVTWLRLEGNNLSGSIPAELGNMLALESLYLSANDLSGPIPPEFGNLPALLKLYLGELPISGEIPPELGNLSTLEFLLMGDTGLTGPLPQTFGKLENLNFVHLIGTEVCEPTDDAFQRWIGGVEQLFSERTLCSTNGPETNTPNTDRPNTDRPNTDRPNTDRPNTDAPTSIAAENSATSTSPEPTQPPSTGQATLTMAATVLPTATSAAPLSVAENDAPLSKNDLSEITTVEPASTSTLIALLVFSLLILLAGVGYGWWVGQRRIIS